MQEVAAPYQKPYRNLIVIYGLRLDVILMFFAAQNLIKPNIRTGVPKMKKPAPVTVRVGRMSSD